MPGALPSPLRVGGHLPQAHLVAHSPQVNPPMKTTKTQEQVQLVLGSEHLGLSVQLAQVRSPNHLTGHGVRVTGSFLGAVAPPL